MQIHYITQNLVAIELHGDPDNPSWSRSIQIVADGELNKSGQFDDWEGYAERVSKWFIWSQITKGDLEQLLAIGEHIVKPTPESATDYNSLASIQSDHCVDYYHEEVVAYCLQVAQVAKDEAVSLELAKTFISEQSAKDSALPDLPTPF